MRIYHVGRHYDKSGNIYYDVSPNDFKGTLSLYFGFDFRRMRWRYQFLPWYSRFTGSVKWFRRAHFSKAAAERHAKRLNDKLANTEEWRNG